MAKLPMFDPQMTEAVCNVLGATDYPGCPGRNLCPHFVRRNSSSRTARTSGLGFYSRCNAQVNQKAGNGLVVFVNTAMHPSRYVDDHRRFTQLQGQLNEVLALFG